MHPKAAIFVGLVAMLAFFWGYFQDSWKQAFESAPVQSATEVVPPTDVSQAALSSNPTSANPFFGGGFSSAMGAYPNPYAGMNSSFGGGINPFAGNIDAIQGGAVQSPPGARNAYFDKLSAQMRELQQNTSANAVTIPNPPMQSPPAGTIVDMQSGMNPVGPSPSAPFPMPAIDPAQPEFVPNDDSEESGDDDADDIVIDDPLIE